MNNFKEDLKQLLEGFNTKDCKLSCANCEFRK